MNQTTSASSSSQLSEKIVLYLNSNLTKKCKLLLTVLYKYQPLKHKELAEMIDVKTNGLTNLILKINKIQSEFIGSQNAGRCKIYSLSPLAEIYTEIVLLPEENTRKNAHTSSLYNDPLIYDVMDSLDIFQEFEGDDWYIVLDDLLFAEANGISITTTDAKEEINQFHMNYSEETYHNYINFKNALINLNVQHGRQAVQKIYGIMDQKILSRRLELLLSSLLDDFYKISPLFQLEKEDSQNAYSIIDRIFSDCFPETFGSNSAVSSKPLESKYCSLYSVFLTMNNEFKNNNYDKAASIEQWKKRFHIKNHYNCISYIAEKCSAVNRQRPTNTLSSQ